MAKCIRCGKGLGLKAKVKLVDGILCRNCFHELGFSGFDATLAKDYYKWDLIKNGKAAYNEYNRKLNEDFRKANPGLIEALSDEENEPISSEVIETPVLEIRPRVILNSTEAKFGENAYPTDGEQTVYDQICSMFPNEELVLYRKAIDYITIMRGDWDIVRVKVSDKAQWIMFPVIESRTKHHIDDVSNIDEFRPLIEKSLMVAK